MPEKSVTHQFSIEGFREGQKQEYNYVFSQFYTLMFHFARNLVKAEAEAKDITTDSFIKLWKLRANFENLNNIKAFLYISTRNSCLDYLRFVQKHRNAQKELLHLSREADENGVQNAMIDASVFKDLSSEIENLPTRCREVFKCIYFHSMDTAQVAETLKISQRNVLNQKAKAIHVLRSALVKNKVLSMATALLYCIVMW